jgi:5'-nucleotidase
MRAPVLLLDMDGPLADFDVHGWERCTALGHEFDVDGPNQQTARYFTDHMPIKAHRTAARQMIEAAGWFNDLPVTPGALEGVRTLLERGVDVWVCTKPLEANPTCRDDKGMWLRRHLPELEHKLILAPDKSMIRGDVLLDDAPKLEWIPLASWRPVIFASPFNGAGSEYEGLARWSWADPIDQLIDWLRT